MLDVVIWVVVITLTVMATAAFPGLAVFFLAVVGGFMLWARRKQRQAAEHAEALRAESNESDRDRQARMTPEERAAEDEVERALREALTPSCHAKQRRRA